jgi:hypothetical protein
MGCSLLSWLNSTPWWWQTWSIGFDFKCWWSYRWWWCTDSGFSQSHMELWCQNNDMDGRWECPWPTRIWFSKSRTGSRETPSV